MKKLLLFFIHILFIQSVNAQWVQVGNVLQRKIVASDTTYRFNMGSVGYMYPANRAYVNNAVSAIGNESVVPNTIVKRNSESGVAAGYYYNAEAYNPANGDPVYIWGDGSNGFSHRYNIDNIRSFMGMPEDGDTFQSVTDRGSTTDNDVAFGRNAFFENAVPTSQFGFLYKQKADSLYVTISGEQTVFGTKHFIGNISSEEVGVSTSVLNPYYLEVSNVATSKNIKYGYGDITFTGTGAASALLDFDNITAARVIQFPDASGTLALTNDQTFTGINTFTGDVVLSNYDNLTVGKELAIANSTGLISDGLLSVNGGDASKFDLASGTGEVVDYATNASSPTINKISWSTFTAQTVTNIATVDKTYVMIDGAGAISQQTTFPTQQERRQKVFIGTLVHPNHSTIQNARTIPDFTQGVASQMFDFFDALGAFNIDGNKITANGANLSFNKSSGHIFRRGANYQSDDQNPHVATLASGAPQSFIKASVNAQIGSSVTVVDPANYDVSGTITAIPGGANTSTIQRVYAFSSGLVFVVYGQTTYSSLADAKAAISTEAFALNPSIADGGVLLGYIVLTKNCTSLNDPSQAIILPAGRFESGAGGGSGSVTTMQGAYNNSATPQITTTTALGPVDIKRGSAIDADNVFRVLNGAGTSTASISGSGLATVSSATISTTPTTSAGGYDYLTRNTSTGLVEKVPSSSVALDANTVHITGTESVTGAKTFTDARIIDNGSLRFNDGANNGFLQNATLTEPVTWTLPDRTMEISGKGDWFKRAIATKTSNYTLTTDDYYILVDASGGNVIITVPASASTAGQEWVIKRIDSSGNTVTIDPNGSETIDGDATATIGSQWSVLRFVSNGTNLFKMM